LCDETDVFVLAGLSTGRVNAPSPTTVVGTGISDMRPSPGVQRRRHAWTGTHTHTGSLPTRRPSGQPKNTTSHGHARAGACSSLAAGRDPFLIGAGSRLTPPHSPDGAPLKRPRSLSCHPRRR